jgi:hypothetical protein
MLQTLGFIFMVFIALLLLWPEVIILVFVAIAGFLDWIAFMVTGKHWMH